MLNKLMLLTIFFLLLPGIVGGSAEYELYKEILGHPLKSSRQSLAVDSEGSLWICSGGLVFRHDGTNWEDFTEISGDASLVSASSDGVLWFADEGQLAHFDGADWMYFPNEIGLPKAISAGPNNILWLVFYDRQDGYSYLARFDGEEIVTYREGLLQRYIGRITATTEGGVWIVYYNFFDFWDCIDGPDGNCPKGTSYFDGATFHHFTSGNGLPIFELGWADVGWIIQNPVNEDIYATCNNDLYKYSNTAWSQVTSGSTSGILVNGNDGEIWCGYMGILNSSVLVSLNLNDDEWVGYDGGEISSMLFDELEWPFSSTMAVTPDGMVWMGFNVREGTNGGVLRINPSTLNSTHVESEQPNAFLYKIFCYPNPFNPSTTIIYTLAVPSRVTLTVYSLTGQKVATLVNGTMSAGRHSALFDGSNLASGLYFYRFIAGDFEKTGSMALVK